MRDAPYKLYWTNRQDAKSAKSLVGRLVLRSGTKIRDLRFSDSKPQLRFSFAFLATWRFNSIKILNLGVVTHARAMLGRNDGMKGRQASPLLAFTNR
jgi:hypothetical protein